MKSNRWLFIVAALIAGIALGLAYGWVIDPVDFFDLTPDTLRADYKADYVLMVAEAYRANRDPGLPPANSQSSARNHPSPSLRKDWTSPAPTDSTLQTSR